MRILLQFVVWTIVATVAGLAAMGAAVERRVSTADGERIYLHSEALPVKEAAPVLVFLHGNEQAGIDTVKNYFAQWEKQARAEGWHLVLPWNEGHYSFSSDSGVRSVQAILKDFAATHAVDPRRIYLVGHGDSAPAVFYGLSRLPDQWAAGLAIGGDMAKAIDSNRLFAGNAAAIPILWIYEEDRLRLLQQTITRLQQAGLKLKLQAADEFTVEEAMLWLKPHRSERLPTRVDYETGSPIFAGAYWLRIRGFDFSLRNDALDSTRVDPGTGAFLRLGGFGYDPDGGGPGLAVKWLPEKYKGPLQKEDVIVSIAGTMIEDARHYSDFMGQQKESRDVGIILLRGGKSQRIETRIVIPHRDEMETARVHGEFLAEAKEIMLVSRGVRSMNVEVPQEWAPVRLTWNGLELSTAAEYGCWTLEEGVAKATKGCAAALSEPSGGAPEKQSGRQQTDRPRKHGKAGAR